MRPLNSETAFQGVFSNEITVSVHYTIQNNFNIKTHIAPHESSRSRSLHTSHPGHEASPHVIL